MNIAVVDVEARVPFLPSFSMVSAEVCDIFDIGAKTCRACQRTVGTAEASFRNFVPSGAFQIPVENIFDVFGIHAQVFRHLIFSVLNAPLHRVGIFRAAW